MRKIIVIISTFGPLHLMKSAEYISDLVDVSVIQGWLPGSFSKPLVKLCSKISGRDLFKSFGKRYVRKVRRNDGVAIPEFYLWATKLFRFLRTNNSAMYASLLYGFFSKKFIKNADVFHVRSGNGGAGAIKIAKKRGMKVLVDHSIAHTNFLRKTLNPEYKRLGLDCGYNTKFWDLITDNCIEADCILVNSDFVKQTFVEEGFEESKIKVAYLGVRPDFFSLKTSYDINGQIQILFTGGFGIRKGARYIIEATKLLDEMEINYKIVVVGACETLEMDSLFKEYKSKNIQFVGFVPQDELKHYFINSDIYLFPSLVEGCASSGMEAMAAGLPVIATKESGLPIDSGKDGVVIKSKDSAEIVNAIMSLIKDKPKREKYGLNAAKKIKDNFSWEQYAKTVVSYYKELIENEG